MNETDIAKEDIEIMRNYTIACYNQGSKDTIKGFIYGGVIIAGCILLDECLARRQEKRKLKEEIKQ